MRFRLLLSVSVFALLTAPALAAFEFVAPAPVPAPVVEMPPVEGTAPQAVVVDPVQMAPLAEPMLELAPAAAPAEPMPIGMKAIPLTPVVKHSDALLLDEEMPAPAPRPVSTSAPVAWDMPAPVLAPTPAPALPKIAAAELADDGGMPIEGFGRQVPLVLALQQIAPPEYRYSFDYGVDAGMRINWTGGKSWKAVITDIARDNSLNVDIVSNVIAFRRRSPMEIVEAQTALDRTPDTVQGMKLKPVAGLPPAPALPSPVSTPVVGASSERPLSILTPLDAAPQNAPAREILAAAKEEVGAPKKPEIVFDPLLDTDKPAKKPVKDKQILTADGAPSAMTALPPVVSPSVAAPEIVFDEAPVWEKPVMANIAADLDTPAEWQGLRNATLRDVLTDWSQQAGVSLVWQSEFDYPLQTDVRIQAGYADAVRTLLAGFGKASPRPIGRLFKNKSVGAQPVLVVETQHLTR